jgi:hypothetical protein
MLYGVANLAAQRFLQDTSLWRQRFRVNLAIFEIKILNFFSLVFCASSAQNIAANREQIDHIFCISRCIVIKHVKSGISRDLTYFQEL